MTRTARMTLLPVTVITALIALILSLAVVVLRPAHAAEADAEFRVLVFSKVTNFYHASIPAGIEAIEKLGA
jgi:cytochrome c